jgi:hypothetical protein
MSDTVIVALITSVIGGVLLKLVDNFFSRRAEKEKVGIEQRKLDIDEGAQIRLELREEIKTLRDEVFSLRKELDDWKEKYYELEQQNTIFKALIKSKGFNPDIENDGQNKTT